MAHAARTVLMGTTITIAHMTSPMDPMPKRFAQSVVFAKECQFQSTKKNHLQLVLISLIGTQDMAHAAHMHLKG